MAALAAGMVPDTKTNSSTPNPFILIGAKKTELQLQIG